MYTLLGLIGLKLIEQIIKYLYSIGEVIRKGFRRIYKIIGYPIIWFIPANESIWVFTSHSGQTFAENPKYQFLYSSKQKDVRAIWISTNERIIRLLQSNGYDAYSYYSLRGQIYLLRSGYIFTSHSHIRPYSANATVIQLWHGNMLKKMGSDRNIRTGVLSKIKSIFTRLNTDYFVVTSQSYPAKHATSAFGYEDDELLITGYPRTDVLFRDIPDAPLGIDDDLVSLFKTDPDQGPLICLMPTWNGGRTEETQFSDSQLDLDQLDSILQSHNARLLIKQHPYTKTPIDTENYEYITSISATLDIYPVINHIDILITDYSSILFDYLLTNNPIIFYSYDLDQYLDNRGLYFDYEEFVPGPIAADPKELNKIINQVLDGNDTYSKERRNLSDEFFKFQDGNACKRIHKQTVDEL